MPLDHADILIRHDEAGVLAAGAEDGHIVGGPAVEGVAGLGSGVDVDRGSCGMAASAGSGHGQSLHRCEGKRLLR